jgi:nitrogen regulatory protein P-II 1
VKRIEAIIRPYRLEAVKDALSRAGVEGLTVTEVSGLGRQKSHPSQYRGNDHPHSLIPKIRVEIVVSEAIVSDAIEAILQAARTGEVGDGKVFVSDIQQVVRIRTGEKGASAL